MIYLQGFHMQLRWICELFVRCYSSSYLSYLYITQDKVKIIFLLNSCQNGLYLPMLLWFAEVRKCNQAYAVL